MEYGDDEELTCGVSDMLHVLSRALFWILGDTEGNWRMVGVQDGDRGRLHYLYEPRPIHKGRPLSLP